MPPSIGEASPQPTVPSSAVMRTKALLGIQPVPSPMATLNASTCAIFMLRSFR